MRQLRDIGEYYQEELLALRKEGYLFGKRHPALAPQLGLKWGENPDPMVERLIESMAWFAARIRRDADARMPLAAQQVLGLIHPNFACPIPSIGIVSLSLQDDDAPGGNEAFANANPAGLVVPAGTRFHCAGPGGTTIRWRTGWPHLLTGVEVAGRDFQNLPGGNGGAATSHSRLTLTLANLKRIGTLRLFLRGDPFVTHPLHEWVHTNLVDVLVAKRGAPLRDAGSLGRLALSPGGLAVEDLVLPRGLYAHPAYQLVQEYFVCPERFLFWDLALPANVPRDVDIDVHIVLRGAPPADLSLRHVVFDPNAAPVVNLYESLAEPISVDHTRHCYPLEPDRSVADAAEVHSILEVEMLRPGGAAAAMPNYFADHGTLAQIEADNTVAWYARRRPDASGRGTTMDLFFKPLSNAGMEEPFTASARVLCTNRGLAESLGGSIRLANDDALAIRRAVMERPPTRQWDPPMAGDELWKLVSAMTAHQRALSGPGGLEALKTLLRLHAPPDSRAARNQIDGLIGLECRDTLRPLRPGPDRPMGGAAPGHDFRARFDREAFRGGSAFLFASVVEAFLGLFAGINTFTRLAAYAGDSAEPFYAWPARSGRKRL